MLSLAFALALFAQDAPATPQPAASETSAPEAAAAVPAEERLPAGAPREDYQFVAWCYGALRGYLDLHDQVMPEVTRIETAYRRPGTKLSDDLKVYADMQRDGRQKLKQFQAALTAAEQASLRPINVLGAEAVKKGRGVWTAGPEVTKARLAQEWMSWALPARCEKTAATLEQRAKVMGSAFRVNEAADVPPAEPNPAS